MLRLLFTVVIVGLALYCVLDVARTPEGEARSLPRLVWVVLVVLFPIVGAVAWLLAGRPRHRRPPGPGGRSGRPGAPVQGPDDDPDFLRSLDGHADRTSDTDESGDGPGDEERSA